MREAIGIEHYLVRKAPTKVPLLAIWKDRAWARADMAEITRFRPESSEHRPRTCFRLLHDANAIHGIFQAEDRFVRCVRTNYGSEVWKDSCVEFFARPREDSGYFNFEFGCGGAFLCCYIVDPERTKDGFKEYTRIPHEIGTRIRVKSSLPPKIDPEINAPLTWTLQFTIPVSIFEQYIGFVGPLNGQRWHGNFFKCAEDVSHPHWASWSPVDEFNFHLPRCFGTIVFE
jgi:hypothetical protein